MPPGAMGGAGGAGSPFDMEKLREMLDDPEIKKMSEQIANDPSFKVMAEQMQANMANMQSQLGALPGGAPGFGMPPGGAMGMPGGGMMPGVPGVPGMPGMDQAAAMEAMQGVMQNPAFMQMAKKLGCLLYTSPSPRDQRGSRMPSSA